MRRLLLTLATPLLMAQGAHFEGSVLVEPARVPTGTKYDLQGAPTLNFTDAQGRTRRLRLPPELDGRLGLGLNLAHYQGTTHALGRYHLPLPPHPALARIAAGARKEQPLHLFITKDGGAWEDAARLDPPGPAGISTFLPLGDGRYLLGSRTLFGQADAYAPFAIYAVNPQKHLVQERLVDLGLGAPLYRAVPSAPGAAGREPQVMDANKDLDSGYRRWHVQRLPAGILLVHGASGRWFLLDDLDGHNLRQGRLWPAGEAEVATLAARPDGRVLVAAFPGSRERSLRAWPRGDFHASLPGGNYPTDPGEALVIRRCEALDDLSQRVRPALRWLALDPGADRLMELASPQNFPPPMNRMELASLAMTLQANGNLRLREDFGLQQFNRIPTRRWGYRLLLPLRLPFQRR
jgi:hypothetical protein